jgi:hypothetical protein
MPQNLNQTHNDVTSISSSMHVVLTAKAYHSKLHTDCHLHSLSELPCLLLAVVSHHNCLCILLQSIDLDIQVSNRTTRNRAFELKLGSGAMRAEMQDGRTGSMR